MITKSAHIVIKNVIVINMKLGLDIILLIYIIFL